jgi:dTDP-4-amino-4,6-dideoxygalactose transaminase
MLLIPKFLIEENNVTTMDNNFIPFHLPSIGQEEIDEVTQTLRSGWLTSGPRTAQFEAEFRDYTSAPFSQAVNSCTAGLHLALAALGIGPGDEVITTPMTFCATVHCILHVGATPVLADIGPDGNIDPASIAERITERTRAIIPVHLGGLPCDMEAIWDLARRHRLYVIEDAAHAVGARIGSMPIGGSDRSDAVAFSFYATKNLTTGEGGMVTTHNAELTDRLKTLCLHGISKDAWNRYGEKGNWHYDVIEEGFKYNLSDIQSAIGIHQLRKQESFLEIRARYADLYRQALADVAEVEVPLEREGTRSAWHLYVLRLNLDRLTIDRDEFIRELRHKGIATSVHFIPIPLHTFFASYPGLDKSLCPKAMELYPRIVSLPLYPAMTESQIEFVAGTIKDLAHQFSTAKSIAVSARS